MQQASNHSTNNTEGEPHFIIYTKRRSICYISANHEELTFHCDDRSYNKSSHQQQLKKPAQKQPLLISPGLVSSIKTVKTKYQPKHATSPF